ncbi:hypothetical protein [Streptomyces griseoaurantiacus]|uniref:Uncharacterized protein n=1 Tax=Streptomyces griseoaurantiacus TaxID=68213 RepID=A0A7W2HT79_9ACTN|nr:hypothetical protein [Streptomyces griseoaurantiacus]MBA5220796.1 hypothetical protein [Streptomyces griseoaurantiacus]
MELLSAFAAGRTKKWLTRISGGALVFWAVAGLAVRVWLPPARGCGPASAGSGSGAWCEGGRFDVVTLCVYGVLGLAAAVGSTLVVTAASQSAVRFLAGTSWPVHGLRGRWTARRVRHHLRVFGRLLAADPVDAVGTASAGPAAEPVGPVGTASDGRAAGPVAVPNEGPVGTASVGPAAEPVGPDGTASDGPVAGPAPAPTTPRLPTASQVLGTWEVTRAREHKRRYPRATRIAPTRIGNSLVAMTDRVTARHGWDLAYCWELIDLALPDRAAGRLRADSDRLTARAQNLLWAVLTCLAALTGGAVTVVRDDGGSLVRGAFLAAAVGAALGVLLLFRGLCAAVDVYCDSVEAVLVTARADIYRAAGWPAPRTPAEERAYGAALSGYLSRRGVQAPHTVFVPPAEPDAPAVFTLLPRPATATDPTTSSAPSANGGAS